MARNSKGQYDKLVTLRVVTNGNPEFFDYDVLFAVQDGESVEIVKVEDA